MPKNHTKMSIEMKRDRKRKTTRRNEGDKREYSQTSG